jgi:hypothetical protein
MRKQRQTPSGVTTGRYGFLARWSHANYSKLLGRPGRRGERKTYEKGLHTWGFLGYGPVRAMRSDPVGPTPFPHLGASWALRCAGS